MPNINLFNHPQLEDVLLNNLHFQTFRKKVSNKRVSFFKRFWRFESKIQVLLYKVTHNICVLGHEREGKNFVCTFGT